MPDFRMQQQFPIADVINASQRKAQIEQQAQAQNNELFNQSLTAIGTIGKSLHDQKKQVAQALALGKLTDVPDDLARVLEPAQVLEAAKLKKGFEDPQAFISGLRGLYGQAPSGGATPTAQVSPSPAHQTGAMLASQVEGTRIPDPVMSGGLTPPTTGPVPVPIQAPPSNKTMSPVVQKMLMQAAAANRPEQVMTQEAALRQGTVSRGTRIINPNSNSDAKEQDKLEQQARQGLQSVRGDTSIKNVEGQRDAAITAYNRLKQIEFSGKPPNPVDYVDILGQVYKARTGTAPTDVVLRDARQQTAEGKFGQVYTFFTGNQAPATSKAIAASLKDMVAHMGLQADELHEGYMQVHGPEIFPSGLAPNRAARLSKVARGRSFTEATGAKPEDYDPHVQAIQWAQNGQKDPRWTPEKAAAILQKAMQAKQGAGGQIGL